jgi:hypothetical protein
MFVELNVSRATAIVGVECKRRVKPLTHTRPRLLQIVVLVLYKENVDQKELTERRIKIEMINGKHEIEWSFSINFLSLSLPPPTAPSV